MENHFIKAPDSIPLSHKKNTSFATVEAGIFIKYRVHVASDIFEVGDRWNLLKGADPVGVQFVYDSINSESPAQSVIELVFLR